MMHVLRFLAHIVNKGARERKLRRTLTHAHLEPGVLQTTRRMLWCLMAVIKLYVMVLVNTQPTFYLELITALRQ